MEKQQERTEEEEEERGTKDRSKGKHHGDCWKANDEARNDSITKSNWAMKYSIAISSDESQNFSNYKFD